MFICVLFFQIILIFGLKVFTKLSLCTKIRENCVKFGLKVHILGEFPGETDDVIVETSAVMEKIMFGNSSKA